MNQNDWIPVSERLPKERDDVLLFLKFDVQKGESTVEVKEIQQGFFYKGAFCLHHSSRCPHTLRAVEAKDCAVTHWMPIDFPPEGE